MTAKVTRLLETEWVRRAIVGLCAAAVFAAALKVPFLAWDDTYYVTQSSRTQHAGLAGLLALWSSSDIWAGRFMEFFPLRDTAYWVLWQLFGRSPIPFHLASILLHALNAGLVLTLAIRLGFARPVAFWGALLFAVHPIHVESIAWIASLKDPMFMSFMLASLILYLKYRERARALEYALCLGCLVAALLVKSLALGTPLLFLAIERLCPPKTAWREAVARVAGPTLIAGIFLAQFVLVGRAAHVLTAPHGGTWPRHLFLAGWALVRYLQQAFAPTSFSLQYCFYPPNPGLDARLPLIVFALGASLTLFWVARRRAPLLALLLAWFFICLGPVANLIPFPSLMADRYLYAPSVASCLVLAWATLKLPGRAPAIVPASLVVVFATVTVLRCMVWQSEAELWREVVDNPACLTDDQPTTAVAYLKHAGFQGDPRQALLAYDIALAHPGFRALLEDDRCAAFIEGSRVALAVQERARAREYAFRAATACPYWSGAWTSVMRAAARVEPQVALDAAVRAFRLSPVSDRQWDVGRARIASGDAAGVSDLVSAVRSAPARWCGPFERWRATANPASQRQVEEVSSLCRF